MSFSARQSIVISLFIAPIVLLGYFFIEANLADIAFSQRERLGSTFVSLILNDDGLGGEAAADLAGRLDLSKQASEFREGPVAGRETARADLIAAVADASNLTLDPDLDSFYVMDAATVRLPRIAALLTDVEQAMSKEGAATPVALDRLGQAVADANKSLTSAARYSRTDAARAGLEQGAVALAQAGEALIEAGADPTRFPAAAQALRQARSQVATAAVAELDALLDQRLAGLYRRTVVSLALVGLALLIGGLLAVALSRNMATKLSVMADMMTRLSREETDVQIPYTGDRNETGHFARALTVFRDGLLERGALRAAAEAERANAIARDQAEDEQRKMLEAERLEVCSALSQVLSGLAQGDLGRRLPSRFPERFASLRDDYEAAVARLRDVMVRLSQGADSVKAGSSEISRAAGDLARRTELQAAGLEEAAATLDEITNGIRESSEDSDQARQAMLAALAEADVGAQVVADAIGAVNDIAASSSRIGQIIGVIDEIAFQTNLLALNAGVEAARAGEAGRGFAVVASEVRGLAQRSAEAAKEIKDLIADSAGHVARGVELVGRSGRSLDQIIIQTREVQGLIDQIVVSARDQANGLLQVNRAVAQMDQTTQSNAAMVEQASAAGVSLADEAVRLSELVGSFRLGEPGAGSRVAA